MEVAKVARLTWLEEKMELLVGSSDVMNLIALDSLSRKFTNCSSLVAVWSNAGGSSINLLDEASIEATQTFLNENIPLLELKKSFEDDVHFIDTMQPHYNFGVCNQRVLLASSEGISRVKASLEINNDFMNYSHPVDSSLAEIASYLPLRTLNPVFESFFDDVISRDDDRSKRLKEFKQYHPENTFVLAFKSSFDWSVEGGPFVWSDIPQLFDESINKQDVDTNILKFDKHVSIGIAHSNKRTYRFTCEFINERKQGYDYS